MVHLLRILPIIVTLLLPVSGLSEPGSATAQDPGRTISFTLLPDYGNNSVDVMGTVSPGSVSLEAADLIRRGFGESLEIWKVRGQDNEPWNVQGSLPNAQIVSREQDGWYHLRLGPRIHLKHGDEHQRDGWQDRPDDLQGVAAV